MHACICAALCALALPPGVAGFAGSLPSLAVRARRRGTPARSTAARASLHLAAPLRSRSGVVALSAEPASAPPPKKKSGFTLYPERWLMLGYLSLLALLSDWVCFSVAATPDAWTAAVGHDPNTLIDIFLFTNVLFCFLEPAIVRRVGLRAVVVGAGAIMAAGCVLRSGLPFAGLGLPEYPVLVVGTVLVGAAQPFFQCTPPLLSSTWFGQDERALATAVCLNFNQVGIAAAFLVGGAMVTSPDGLSEYFSLISVAALLVAAGAFFQFRDRPPTPPTSSAAARIAAEADPAAPPPDNFLVTAGQLLRTPGFLPPLCAFVASIGITNVVSAFTDETLTSAGIVEQSSIDLAGAGFQAAIVIGGIVLGGYVDKSQRYKQVTMGCLLASLLILGPLGTAGMPHAIVVASLLSLGALAGPVQPINAELAVEVAYPADENAIEALQQLCGNLFSALLVPVAERAATVDVHLPGDSIGPFHGDTALLGGIALGALAFFNTFDAPLKRSELDCAYGTDLECELGDDKVQLEDEEATA